MNPPTLTTLGRYQIVRVLARGAMGVVYEARDVRLGRTVAIKTVLRAHLDDEATAKEYAARFEREAKAAARMAHPNIVTVYDFGDHEGELSYIVMEFVRGRELASFFKGGEIFTPAESVRIVGQLLDALHYAHERDVVHRDVKPANVLIDERGQVKLTDFGVARLAGGTQERTMPGTLVGTPNYMSPEQILGQSVGSRTDLFAAGVLLYQCLTGVQPFGGGGMFEVQRRILHEEPAPPSSLRSELPAAVDAVVARALAKDPEQRYESAAAFAAELRRVAAAALPAVDVAVEVDPDATVLLPLPRAGTWDATVRPLPTGAPVGPGATTTPPAARSGATAATAIPAAAAPSAFDPPSWIAPGSAARVPPPPQRRRATLRMLWAVSALSAAGAGLAWWALRSPAPVPAAGVEQAATPAPPVTAPAPMPAASASAAAAAPALASPSAPTATPATAAPTPEPRQSDPTPAPAEPVRTQRVPPAAARPGPEKAPAPATTVAPAPAPAREPHRATVPPAAYPTAPRASSERCGELLERLQLGEALTPEQSGYFQSRCTR